MEVSENRRDQQRREVTEVMAAISRFRTLASDTKILEEERDIELKARFGRPTRVRTTPKFGVGFGFAFGIPGRFKIRGDADAMTKLTSEQIAALENNANALAEWMMMSGPTSEQRPTIPGYDPYAARQVADRELDRIGRVVKNLRADPHLYRRLEDVLGAQEYAVEFLDLLNQALEHAGIRKSEWLTNRDDLIAFLLARPSRHDSCAISARDLQGL